MRKFHFLRDLRCASNVLSDARFKPIESSYVHAISFSSLLYVHLHCHRRLFGKFTGFCAVHFFLLRIIALERNKLIVIDIKTFPAVCFHIYEAENRNSKVCRRRKK